MKKIHFPIIALILILTSCKSEFGSFNEEVLTFANNDKRIDEKEYQKLLEQISGSDEKGFQQFKNVKDEIDNIKVVSYLLKYFKAKNVGLTANDIWQPETKSTQGTFNINVYLENSASMDGYVKGVTEFETAIYNLLGDFKISGLCDSLNLNYINKTIPYKKQNALPADIQDFIEKLEPSDFKQRGGDRSVSDLKNILNSVLKTVNDKNAAVLISDFVFSPGKNANAQDYLNNQGVGIKIDFAEKLKDFDLSAVVIQLQSNFDGLYYDKTDKPLSFKGKRPYYVWIFGSTQQISSILNKKVLDNIKGGYSNRLVLQSIKEISEPNYKILYSPKIGSFSAKQLNAKIISDASASKENQNKGLFGFNVAVDFSKCLQDENYFLDTNNYILSNTKYQLTVETITDKNDASLSGFTHLLKLQTTELREEVLKIDIVGKTPSWVFNSTSIDDSKILSVNSEQQKTFGLQYLIEGVNDAFYPKSKSNSINSISIKIKK
jgi:predicted adenine nucleotide alpha hydrolase (AANH) superfamily ATPase